MNDTREHNHYGQKAFTESAVPQRRTVRIAKELSGMFNSLPLEISSSVFIRYDQSKNQLWKALITGPDDTPYAGGCFLFDAYFPPEYPGVPPMMNLRTTGGGKVRFNPNLYNCGKVCLSLLGTWSGGVGEGWDSAASSMLQVLVSIQSLIFVDQPFYNEPGYERMMHTPDGNSKSKEYNAVIRDGTVRYAILEMVKSPPKEFAEVVRRHFSFQRKRIEKVLDEWVSEQASLASLVRDVKQEFAKLPPPESFGAGL